MAPPPSAEAGTAPVAEGCRAALELMALEKGVAWTAAAEAVPGPAQTAAAVHAEGIATLPAVVLAPGVAKPMGGWPREGWQRYAPQGAGLWLKLGSAQTALRPRQKLSARWSLLWPGRIVLLQDHRVAHLSARECPGEYHQIEAVQGAACRP